MKRLRLLLVLGFVLIPVAPVFAQDTCEVQRQIDETTGAVSALSTVPEFRQVLMREHGGARGEGTVSMSLAYQPGLLQMGIYVISNERTFVDGEGVMEVEINGEPAASVQAIGSQTHDLENTYLEVVAFNLSEDVFRQIASGERVRLNLPARPRIERELRSAHLNCFKLFLEELER